MDKPNLVISGGFNDAMTGQVRNCISGVGALAVLLRIAMTFVTEVHMVVIGREWSDSPLLSPVSQRRTYMAPTTKVFN
jgi:hypothetical protein